MASKRINLIALVAQVFTTSDIAAWNYTGHEVIALLTHESLSPATRARIVEILEHHPHFNDHLAKNIPADVERDRWILMKAATWSDWIRSGPQQRTQYHRGTWHYINIPYIVADDPATVADINARFKDPNINRGDILKIIPESVQILKMPADTQARREERAVRLCWLFHLVGDLHQPLHAVARCTKELPDGDRGANLVWVTRRGDGEPRRLHMVWDNMLGNFESYKAVAGLAALIKRRANVNDNERLITDPATWAQESHKLAVSDAYNFRGTPIDCVVVNADAKDPAVAPRLPDEYEPAAIAISRQRAALAAARLADLLAAALAE